MKGARLEDLQAQCCSAALGDIEWQTLLQNICQWIQGDRAMFLRADHSGSYQVPYSYGLNYLNVEKYNKGLDRSDPHLKFSKRIIEEMVKSGQNPASNENLKNTPLYNEIGNSLHLVILDTVQFGRIALSIYRDTQKEPFSAKEVEKLKSLQPHLVNAFHYSVSVLGFCGDIPSSDTATALINNDLLVVSLTGNLRHILESCETLKYTGNFLRSEYSTVTEYLHLAISHAIKGKCSSAKLGFGKKKAIDQTRCVKLGIQKVPNSILWTSPGCNFTLARISIESNSPPSVNTEIFAKTFKLTLAEQRLIKHLQSDDNLREAANQCNINYETARWHVKNILQKTLYPKRQDLVQAVRELDLSSARE
ncbi:hypothetical protein LIHA111178_12445 [Litorimonas haliclonae]